jgi:hypothetical protein
VVFEAGPNELHRPSSPRAAGEELARGGDLALMWAPPDLPAL